MGDNRITQDRGGLPHHHAVRRPARHLGRRARAVPDDGRARLPQRGRQAHQRRRDRAVLRPPRASPTWSAASTTGSTARPRRNASSPRSQGFFDECLLLADDFRQYYLGAMTRVSLTARRTSSTASRTPINGYHAAARRHAVQPARRGGLFQPTSDVLPAGRVPAVPSARAPRSTTSPATRSRRSRARATPGALHQDASYMRLTRTIDLSVDQRPRERRKLQFQLSYQHRAGVRPRDRRGAHRGPDDWTTLPDLNGAHADQPAGRVHGRRVPARAAPVPAPLPRRADCRSRRARAGPGTRSPARRGGWYQVTFDLVRPTRASRSRSRSPT